MSKSEHYLAAMLAVIEADFITNAQKIEVLETLMEDKRIAIWHEQREEVKNEFVHD